MQEAVPRAVEVLERIIMVCTLEVSVLLSVVGLRVADQRTLEAQGLRVMKEEVGNGAGGNGGVVAFNRILTKDMTNVMTLTTSGIMVYVCTHKMIP